MTQVVMAAVLGLLFAVGTFLVLRRDVVRVVWGVAIMSQAANVYLVTMGGLRGAVPILDHGAHPPACKTPAETGTAATRAAGEHAGGCVTDPLVQALVLTAIVIGFGTTAFALVLTFRFYEEHGTIDLWETEDAESGDGTDDVAADGGTDSPRSVETTSRSEATHTEQEGANP